MKILKPFLALLIVAALAIVPLGCGGADADSPTISVASKAWTEQLILGSMLLELLDHHGYPTRDRLGLGESDVIRPALHSGEVDAYWEYTGTTLMTFMHHDVITDPEEAFQTVKAWDAEENQVAWLPYSSANNTYAILMQRDQADALGLSTISDLADYLNDSPGSLTLATDDVFYERPDGIMGLQEAYDFTFEPSSVIFMGTGLTYGALNQGEVDLAMGFGTDGRIAAFDFAILEDDQGFFPVYNPAPVFRQEILDAYPDIASQVGELSALLDHETLIELNMRVDIDEVEPEDVAIDFLRDHGLID